jgi:hypothetical protein
MGFFKSLFGRGDPVGRNSPFGAVSFAIILAASICQQRMKQLLHCEAKQDAVLREMRVFDEYLFFFMHMANRAAHSQGLDVAEVQKAVFAEVIATAIEPVILKYPKEHKARIRSEFYNNMNSAEIEYAPSTKLISEDYKPLSSDTLLAKLSRKVAAAMAQDYNPEVLFQASQAGFIGVRSANLPELVKRVVQGDIPTETEVKETMLRTTRELYQEINAPREARFSAEMKDLSSKAELGYEKAAAAYLAGEGDSNYERHMTQWYARMKAILSDQRNPEPAAKLRATLEQEYKSDAMGEWDKAQIAKLLGK